MSVILSRVGGTGADLPASMVRVGGISTDIDMYDDGLSVSGETINDINVEALLYDGSFHVVVSETCSVSDSEPVTKTRISTLVYDDSYNVEMVPTGGMSVRMSLVCSIDISKPYLEIAPTILWMPQDHGDNDVYSNTFWLIEQQ